MIHKFKCPFCQEITEIHCGHLNIPILVNKIHAKTGVNILKKPEIMDENKDGLIDEIIKLLPPKEKHEK